MSNKRNFTYSDVDKALTITDEGNVKILYDEDCIIQSIRLLMATVSGERVRNNFGSSLIRLLFREMSQYTADDIGDFLTNQIEIFEPRVTVDQVTVKADFNANAYVILIEMTINKINKKLTYPTRINKL